MLRFSRKFRFACRFVFTFTFAFTAIAYAAPPSLFIHGTVSDPSGALIANAKVELIENDAAIVTVTADTKGQYVIHRTPAPGSRLRVSSPGFRTVEKALATEGNVPDLTVDIRLPLTSFSEQITVTSTGTPTPQAQLGATVTVLMRPDYEGTRDIQEGLRLVPGLQVTQTGQAGGTTSLFIRGGGSNANKLLIDGISANDIGGAVEFANIASSPW